MHRSMGHLSDATYRKFRYFHSSTEAIAFVSSIARCNLEFELLHGDPQLTKPGSTRKRSAMLPLLHILGIRAKILSSETYTDLWTRLTECRDEARASMSVQIYQKEVPLLLRDPSTLLIHFTLLLPPLVDAVHFQALVSVLYNLVFVQAQAVMTCKFTEDEREAWKQKHTEGSVDSLGGMLSIVIRHLAAENSRLFQDVDMSTLAICQSVWSPQSVETTIQMHCLPFLRLASLLKYHLYDVEIPTDPNPDSEFQHLCCYLGLVPKDALKPKSGIFPSASALIWHTKNPLKLAQNWCREFIGFANEKPDVAKNLLVVNPVWYPARLYQLPKEYDKIFQTYRLKQCNNCTTVPREPALCLVCGQLLCFKDRCCQSHDVHECVQHSIVCGAGTGIFLIVNSSVIVVISGARATLWGSVYLDAYGEEDRDLKRGKPLYLSKDRYSLLEKQWSRQLFDHVCKKWIWHKDHL